MEQKPLGVARALHGSPHLVRAWHLVLIMARLESADSARMAHVQLTCKINVHSPHFRDKEAGKGNRFNGT